MSVDLRRIRCSGIRLGYPGSTGALASHVIEHESPGPADLLTRTARLVLKFEQADFRCHFSSVDVRNGWAHPRPAHGDDSVTLVLPEAKYAIVHTLVGAVAEDVAIDVSDVKGASATMAPASEGGLFLKGDRDPARVEILDGRGDSHSSPSCHAFFAHGAPKAALKI
eukprot:scaffold275742_cov33-Tisochrysis_lutea.AAC.1